VIPEPLLEFRYGQRVHDPRDGLSLFGPFDSDAPSHPSTISYGLVGTEAGLEQVQEFIDLLRSPIFASGESANLKLWPAFPGFEVAFSSRLPPKPTRKFSLVENDLLKLSRNRDPNQRAYSVVDYYLEGVKDVLKGDEKLQVVICVVPERVYLNCRPRSAVLDGIGDPVTFTQRKLRAKGQEDLFVSRDLQPYQFSVDFRRQLKARVMELDMPIQIIRETTLRLDDTKIFGERGLTPLSDRAWNLSTALYYKAGGKPFRLSGAREGVCYVGLVYKKAEAIHDSKTACCAAQMFLDSGDGVVLRSDFGPWYSPETKQLHLDTRQARKLLLRVLKTYENLEGKPLKEVFLHYRSEISGDEFTAFRAACPEGVKVVGIRVREDRYGLHLYREGKLPIIRGTFWKINERIGYLWASGFKSRLGTYDGVETPVPLRIEIQFGQANMDQVATDILGLTKLNYNECKFGDSAPVTIGFSDAVGEILVTNPSITEPNNRFKFYI